MLTMLHIENFTIVEQMSIEFNNGLTVITGETGAGKSIAMDALTFALGAKLDPSAIRQGAEQCTISASFFLQETHPAVSLLNEWGMSNEDHEYVFSRTITSQGRSQARLNGAVISLPQLKQLSPLIVDIHGQHAHQRLLRADFQRDILDAFAQSDSLVDSVKERYQAVKKTLQLIAKLETAQQQQQQQRDLLSYQLAELQELAPEENEWDQLNQRHTLLSNAESLIEQHQNLQFLLNDGEDGNILSWLDKVTKLTGQLSDSQQELKPTHEAFIALSMECREHQRDLLRAQDRIEMDPEALQETSSRVEHYLRLSKKHRIAPEELYAHQQALQQQLDALQDQDSALEDAYQKLPGLQKLLSDEAEKLSTRRQDAGKSLSEHIAKELAPLNMPHARLIVDLEACDAIQEYGAEKIRFLFSANPGQAPVPLQDGASGGELSRLSLVLQVAINGKQGAGTLVFDEVDTGISGPTASVVGSLLKRLGRSTQIISITHLPQVAACADEHFLVSKTYQSDVTHSSMVRLASDSRVNEVARLLGAQVLTPASIENAKELLRMSEAA